MVSVNISVNINLGYYFTNSVIINFAIKKSRFVKMKVLVNGHVFFFRHYGLPNLLGGINSFFKL